MSDTVGGWVERAARRLAGAGVGRPRAEARALLAAALEAEAPALFAYPERALARKPAAAAAAMLARRLAGEPAGRILGWREFWSLPFRLGPDVLEPRPDTETVVETALALRPARPDPRILDLGVGSGCILLALLSELPAATGIGVDRAAGAVAAARRNAADLGLKDRTALFVGDWAAAMAAGVFDLVVANPPYVARAAAPAPDAATLGYDPPAALWGGVDGLAAYRKILPDFNRLLAPGGVAAIEVGAGQAAAVTALATAHGLAVAARRRDLGGHVRCLGLRAA